MELVISIISLITAIIALLTSVLPTALNTQHFSVEFDNKYNQLRTDVATALTMYACYYHNPVDLAEQADHRLPQNYETASVALRALGSTASALAAIIPEKKRFQARKADLIDVSGYLIGLSNSMQTPYNCSMSTEEKQAIRDWEAKTKKALKID